MTIRAVIVDDEPLARRRIRDLLAAAPDVEVVAECANGKEAIQAIEASPPDLLFLDIQMPRDRRVRRAGRRSASDGCPW